MASTTSCCFAHASPSAGEPRYWQRRFDHGLVDEFQDTNAAQLRLVKQSPPSTETSACRDDDQAISTAGVGRMCGTSLVPAGTSGTTLIKPSRTIASTQGSDAANGVIAENARRLGKTLFTRRRGGRAVTAAHSGDERGRGGVARRRAQPPGRPDVRPGVRRDGGPVRTNSQSRRSIFSFCL